MKLVIIGINEDGQRVDRLVGKLIPHAEKGLVYKAIRKKIVTLNGKKTQPDARVKEGDELRLFFADETLINLGGTLQDVKEAADTGTEKEYAPKQFGRGEKGKKTENVGFDFSDNIIYEDDDVILVYKPAGILTQGAMQKKQRNGQTDEVSLNDLLIAYLNEKGKLSGTGETFKPSVCNRLDRNTSGIVVCGCSLKGLRVMSKLIHDRSLKKFYLCAVKGIIREPGVLTGWLVKDEESNKVRIYKNETDIQGNTPGADKGITGKGEAVGESLRRGRRNKGDVKADAYNIETRYRPLKSAHEMTLLEVELVTGRPHQIRAHMASIGHPVAGDPKYGDAAFNRMIAKEYGIKHQVLTAWRLVFPEKCQPEPQHGNETRQVNEPQHGNGSCLEALSGREFRAEVPSEVTKLFGVDRQNLLY
ncbi:MAG: RluA family pseudouridine synthase [Lachnospiraceae bacterium]|nr:RluA family pseudouridine synthase [Lachnospiraceae bacterium]